MREVQTFKTDKLSEPAPHTSPVNPSIPKTPKKPNNEILCILHDFSKHHLKDCKAFDKFNHQDKRDLLSKNGLCFRCFGTHLQCNCTEEFSCSICSKNHMTVMHRPFISNKLANPPNHRPTRPSDNNQSNLCTEVCNSRSTSTCSKVVLVDITLPSKTNLSLRFVNFY